MGRRFYNQQAFLSNRLEPAVRSKPCPICLTTNILHHRAAVIATCLHAYCIDCILRWSNMKKKKRKCPLCNSEYDSLFCQIDFKSGTFIEHRLPVLDEVREGDARGSTWHHHPLPVHRVIRRSREEFNSSNQRTRPLPRQRWFEKPGQESSDAVAQRVLRWRLNIYEQRLQAIPHFSQSHLHWKTTRNNSVKERILQRTEPWICRELNAILGDIDPSIIIHVASSLFITSLEVSAEQSTLKDSFLDPLRPFLRGLTDMFWHELRCFAGSPVNMETYDTVVEYRKVTE